MAKYFRRRSSSRFRRKYSRPSRVYRRLRTQPGSKRFFKRQRRLAKPEIKWNALSTANTAVPANTISPVITPVRTSFPLGPEQGSRIGSNIKLRKVMINVVISSYEDSTLESNRSDGLIRLVIWYPTRNYTESATYMTTPNLSVNNWQVPFDWNAVRVVRDVTIRIGLPSVTITSGTTILPQVNAYPSRIQKKFMIPWPRSVDFGPTSTILDIDKDIPYMTIINPNTFEVRWDLDSKITYIDP